MSQTKRCFIAIDLPENICNEIKRLQEQLYIKNVFDASYTNSKQAHLTLVFLGNISQNQIIEIKEKLEKIKFHQIKLSLDKLGYFDERKIKIMWIGLKQKELIELHKKIKITLRGIVKQDIEFIPHITIARIKKYELKEMVKDTVLKTKVNKIQFDIDTPEDFETAGTHFNNNIKASRVK